MTCYYNITKLIFLKKKTETGSGSVWFFRTKTGSNRFGLVFSVWLGFIVGLTRFFWFGFGSVFLVSDL